MFLIRGISVKEEELCLNIASTNYILNSAIEISRINSDINNYLLSYNEFLNYTSITSNEENNKFKDKIVGLL